MRQFYSSKDCQNSSFLPYPSEFIFNPLLRRISGPAKELYALLRYRMNISMRNPSFEDEKGLFVIYSQKELCEQVGVTERTIRMWFAEAKKYHLIETSPQGCGKPLRIYISNIDYVVSVLTGSTTSALTGSTSSALTGSTSSALTGSTSSCPYREERIHEREYREKKEIANPLPEQSNKFLDKNFSSKTECEKAEEKLLAFAGMNDQLREAMREWLKIRRSKLVVTDTNQAKYIIETLEDFSGGDQEAMYNILRSAIVAKSVRLYPPNLYKKAKRNQGGDRSDVLRMSEMLKEEGKDWN